MVTKGAGAGGARRQAGAGHAGDGPACARGVGALGAASVRGAQAGAWAGARTDARGAWQGRVGRAGCWGTRAQQQERGAHDTQAWARPGRAAGLAGFALDALNLFLTRFDSVLFLIQFLDIVREPGS